MSTRDPSLIIPYTLAAPARGRRGCTRQTMRRASKPAICTKRGTRPSAASHHDRVLLVVERRLVRRRRRGYWPVAVVHADDRAVDRRAVHVDVERRHEDADLRGTALEEARSSTRASAIATTLPSAGRDRRAPGRRAASRSGSRKKLTRKPAARDARAPRREPPAPAARADASSDRDEQRRRAPTDQRAAVPRERHVAAISSSTCRPGGSTASHGIRPRSVAPTSSIGWCSPSLRSSRKCGDPAAILGHPLVGELAATGSRPRIFFIAGARLGTDHPLAARHVAVLGGVADRVAHVGDAALVDQVDDQLHLVQALEVRHLGRVARLDERLVAGADQLGEPAAEHRLLAEEIGLGLLAEAWSR